MSYKHLNTFERARIEIFYEQGNSIRAIAKKLDRSPSTISRELKRNSQRGCYTSEKSQESYNERRFNCGRIGKWSPDLADIINEKLELCLQFHNVTPVLNIAISLKLLISLLTGFPLATSIT